MVETKEDIAKIDLSAIQAADAPKKAATATPVAAPVAAPTATVVVSASSTSSFFDEFDKIMHSGAFKISPSASWYMRTYCIMPSELKATGPKGFIIKSDVIEHIESKKLVKGQRAGPAAPAAPKAEKKAESPKKAATPKSTASPVFDPSNPFQQTWSD